MVDDLNPVLNFTRKEVESLLHFVEEEHDAERKSIEFREDFEPVLYQACHLYPYLITKVQLHHNGYVNLKYLEKNLEKNALTFFLSIFFIHFVSTATFPT